MIGKKLFFFRNFIVIDDLLKILKILIFDNSFGIYNIGSNLTYRFDNVIKKYCNSINVKPLKSDFDDENFFFENYNKLNISIKKLRKKIGSFKFTDQKIYLKKLAKFQKNLFL